MGWKSSFSSIIKERGFTYYLGGKVTNVKVIDQYATATIQGSTPYQTSVRVIDKAVTLRCSCPYAESYHCKHEAALCYYLEENHPNFFKGKKQEKKEIIPPAPEASLPGIPTNPTLPLSDLLPPDYDFGDAEDTLLDLKTIFSSVKVLPRTYKVAESLRFTREKHTFTKTGGPALSSEGTLSYYNFATLTLKREGIVKKGCSFQGCRASGETVCEHELALLLSAAEYLKENRPGDYTDVSARAFLSKYGNIPQIQTIEEQKEDPPEAEGTPLELRGILEKSSWNLSLSLVIQRNGVSLGVDDIASFLDAYCQEEVYHYARRLPLDFSRESFSEDSRPLLDLLIKLRIRNTGRVSTLSLTYSDLDMLHKALSRKNLPLYTRDGVLVEARTELFPVRLRITDATGKSKKELLGIKCSLDIPKNLYHGRKCKYQFEDGVLTSYEDKDIRAFVEAFSGGFNSPKEMKIGIRSIPQFFGSVVPSLPSNVKVEDNTSLASSLIPDKPFFRFRLDYIDKIVVCTPSVSYSDGWHPLPSGYAKAYRPMEDKVMEILGKVLGVPLSGEEIHVIDDDKIYSLIKGGVQELKKYGSVECTDSFLRLMGLLKAPEIKVEGEVANGLLDLEFLSDEVDAEELYALLADYKARRRFRRLKNGRFVELDAVAELDKVMALIEDLGLTLKDALKGKLHLPLFRAFYLDQKAKEIQGGKEIASAGFRAFVDNFEEKKAKGETDPPENLKASLRDYQKAGFHWLRLLKGYGFGGILADDMGLGKTLEMISVLLSFKNDGERGTSLVVCPSSLVYNWKKEVKRFAPDLDAVVLAGSARERQFLLEEYRNHDLLITSYDILKRDIEHYEGKQFSVEVLDEAQYIKNSGTLVAKAAKAIDATTRYALTGTPIENRLTELWSIFDYLMPGYLYSQEKFRERFARKIENDRNVEVANELRRLTAPFILRRVKEEVLTELPEKSEEVYYIELEGQQKKLYEAEVMKIKDALEKTTPEAFKESRISFFAELMKVRQLCQDPHLVYSNFKGESTKRKICLELVAQAIASGHKILIFSQFVSLLDLLAEDLQKEKIEYYTITGSTDKKKRLEMAEEFNANSVPVFLISLRAGGTGLNLTGADMVIHFDPWWNNAVMDQATDRTHRIGQTRPVTVYKLITEGTIEEKILAMQERKKNLADDFIRNGGETLTTLSKEEILELLG